MALTNEDLQNITQIVDGAKTELMAELAKKADVDRMESRLVTAIGLLERDTAARLTDLEARVARLA